MANLKNQMRFSKDEIRTIEISELLGGNRYVTDIDVDESDIYVHHKHVWEG